MASTSNIRSSNWTLSTSVPYELVQGVNALKQSIEVILETTKGSAPLMLDFGINHTSYIGMPITQAGPRLLNEIRTQVTKYEPRVKIKNLSYSFEDGRLNAAIEWTYNGIIGVNTLTI